MKNIYYYFLALFLLNTNCYISKEHKQWDKRSFKNLPDVYFYEVLKDSCLIEANQLSFDTPYLCFDEEGYFKTYVFDSHKKVYSCPWNIGNPRRDSIFLNQKEIGYFKICDNIITIERISSWKLFNIPWKYVHSKQLGIIVGDTIKFSRSNLDIKQSDNIVYPLDNFIIMNCN